MKSFSKKSGMAMEGSIVETQHLKGGGGSKASASVNNLPSVKWVRNVQVISLKPYKLKRLLAGRWVAQKALR